VRELFDAIYRFLRSKLLAVVVILALAVFALLGTMIQQAPTFTDSAARADWVESVRPRYGGWTSVFDYLGFFNLWSSPLFLGTAVLLALSIIACTVHRLPQLWARATRPRTHVTEKFFERAQYRAELALPLPPDEAADHVRRALAKQRYRWLPDEKLVGGQAVGFYADRFRWGPFGTAIAHAAMVVILAAFAVSAFTGFEENLDIAVGETVEVGHGTGLTVRADSFKDSYDDMGRPTDYVSHLVVLQDGAQVAAQDVRVNTPLRVGDTALHQASFGIAAAVSIADAAGSTLFAGSVPLKWSSTDGRYAIGKVTPEGTGIEVLVVTPASGAMDANIEAGSAVFELYSVASGEKLDVVPAAQGETVTSGALSLTFEREQRYTGIIARQDPGAVWMWVGSALLIIGMSMTFMLRHRRLWVRAVADEGGSIVRIASAEKLDSTFERHFRALVEQIDATAPDARKELLDA
jgi:cytochrome c biogenesis protein